ncbi:hypothetical protein L218DRAFT_982651 [Marasmius fiardii PR-910]|nr:hypothetical protein L218DRAFT_982651 [Marasmius fiardii PR-910]
MVEKKASRPWTKAEDELLRNAVKIHGAHDNWKLVAQQIPDRDNKACRKRWLHSLCPSVKKTSWTAEEDSRLLELLRVHGQKWSLIARQIPGRTDDACSKRYNEALDPNLKKSEWTSEEDEMLLRALSEIGHRSWKEIGQRLRRSGLDCRNRYKLLERKRKGTDSLPVHQQSQETMAQCSVLGPPLPFEPPYYPREAYPLFQEGSSISYQESVPDAATLPLYPEVAPFQFSSSSLSSALEDSLQSSVTFFHPSSIYPSSCNTPSAQPSPTLSPAGHASGGDLIDESILLGNFPTTPQFIYANQSLDSIYSEGPISIDTPIPGLDTAFGSAYLTPIDVPKSPLHVQSTDISSFYDRNAGSPFTETSPETNVGEISANCSPYEQVSQLSPSTSDAVVDNPPACLESLPSESLLFSDASTSRETRLRKQTLGKRITDASAPQRLSTIMPLCSDRTLRPYACGHRDCWPAMASVGISCFATSKELWEHSRAVHLDDFGDERPFRCALEGCGKSWKSLNGIQYHLQVSTAHFQQALSSTFSSIGNEESQQFSQDSSVEQDGDDHNKRFVCDQPHCFKTYKNASGLRYHKKHGHPRKLPMQLVVMPPSLARDLPSRIRKMRKKETHSHFTVPS